MSQKIGFQKWIKLLQVTSDDGILCEPSGSKNKEIF
jgi:hypothetical protein